MLTAVTLLNACAALALSIYALKQCRRADRAWRRAEQSRRRIAQLNDRNPR